MVPYDDKNLSASFRKAHDQVTDASPIFIEQASPGALNTAIARQPAPTRPPINQPSAAMASQPAIRSQPVSVAEPALEPYATQSPVPFRASGINGTIVPESIPQIPGSSPSIIQPQPTALVESSISPPIPKKNDGRLGVILDTKNLTVRQVEIGSAADLGGLRPGDKLVAINGQSIQRLEEVQSFLQQRPAVGLFTVDRNNQPTVVQVKF
jgi:S1-C subfamily serine protease